MSDEMNNQRQEATDGVAVSSDGEVSSRKNTVRDGLDGAREKISENTERAEKNAIDIAAKSEYGSEYRQKLLAREKRLAAKQRRERLLKEAEEERERQAARRQQIEEFIAAETAQNEKKAQEVVALPEKAEEEEICDTAPLVTEEQEEIFTEKETVSEICENDEIGEQALEDLPETEEKDEINEEIKDEEKNEEENSSPESSAITVEIRAKEKDRILLSVGYDESAEAPKPEKPKRAEKTLLKNGASRELRVAEIKHQALVAAAIQSADGSPEEEIRLLEIERKRYDEELEKIRKSADDCDPICENIVLARQNNTDSEDELMIHLPYAVLGDYGMPHGYDAVTRTESDSNISTDTEKESTVINIGESKTPPTYVHTPFIAGAEPPAVYSAAVADLRVGDAPYVQGRESYSPFDSGIAPDFPYGYGEYPTPDYSEQDYAKESEYERVYRTRNETPAAPEEEYDSLSDSFEVGEELLGIGALDGFDEYGEYDGFDGESAGLGYSEDELGYEDMHELDYHDGRDDSYELVSDYDSREQAHRPTTYFADHYEHDAHEDVHARYLEDKNAKSIALYAKSELVKRLEECEKQIAICQKQLRRLEDEQKNAVHEKNILLITQKIGVQKEICELLIEALHSCVYADARIRINRYKKKLLSAIDGYNRLCEEYEKATGQPAERISPRIVDDIIAGIIPAPIANVYHYGDGSDPKHDLTIAEAEHQNRIEHEDGLVEEEYLKYLDGDREAVYTKSELKANEKRNAARMSAARRASERDVLLVGLRNEYRLSSLLGERDTLASFYSTDKKRSEKKLQALDKKIHKIKSSANRAIKLEREDNSRYYLLSLIDPSCEKVKNGARPERLMALRMRLAVLLSEREAINERLIALYGGADKNLTTAKINRKAGAVRRKSAKSMYKRQLDIADKIDRAKVSRDMKRFAYDLLNKKIEAASIYDECYYKYKKIRPTGRAKKELVNNMNRAKIQIKSADRELKYILKRFKRYERYAEADREWAVLLIAIALISLAGVGLWALFGDKIVAYFSDLISKFK